MIRFRKFLPLVAVLACVVTLAAPTQARADLYLQITDSAGTINVGPVPGSPTALPTGTLAYTGLSANGEFFISALVTGYTQTAAQGELLTTDLSITRIAAGSGTITFTASGNNFSLPAGNPLQVFSGAGGTYTPQVEIPAIGAGGSAALTFQSYFDASNTLTGTASTTGLQPANPPSSTTPATFDTGEVTGLFARPNPLYSLRNDTVITLDNGVNAFTLVGTDPVGGSVLGFQGHTITRAVPAPAGLVLAFSALPALGGYWLRRRKSQAV